MVENSCDELIRSSALKHVSVILSSLEAGSHISLNMI